jgi:cell division protein FtsI/penicillin-binding protein 2
VVVVAGGAAWVTSRGPDHAQAVQRYAQAWERGDWKALHATLTAASADRIPVADLAQRYELAASTATAGTLVAGTPVQTTPGHWRLPVTVATRVFGPVQGSVDLDIVEESGEARIAWRNRLVFPGLADGDRLARTTTLPERADLLARDGTALAHGPDRTSTLGAGADAIVGALGPIPDDRRVWARERGLPDDTQVGLTGLERIFDERLLGTPGGQLRAGLRLLAERAPRKAPAVRTTIAPKVQTAAVAALAGRLGGIVALRPRSGQILAAAGIGFSGLQPPGSTFKVLTLTGALEARLAKPSDTFPVQTAATLEGVELANANHESCGGTLAHAFAESCNSVFAPLGAKLGAARLVDVAERFGFNKPIGIPGAAMSTIPPATEIGDNLAVGSTAIGQGRVQATALQMALVSATIALHGRRPAPTFDATGPDAAPTTRATDAATARTVARLMLGVTRGGTGTAAAIEGIDVAGKTGTAELRTTQPCKPDLQGQDANNEACKADMQADPTDTDAWFTAFAPAGSRTPRAAVGVLLVGAGAGGDTAAPAAKTVLLAALQR